MASEKKRMQMNLMQNRNRLTEFENLRVTKGDRWGVRRMVWGLATGTCTLRPME